MKPILFLLLLPVFASSQTTADQRQLIALKIDIDPDHVDSNEYYLVVSERPASVEIKQGQTFIVQSIWRKEGDSVVTTGVGTVQEKNDYLGLRFYLYPGKTVKKGDMALFLVPLDKPTTDTLLFKMARLGIGFKSVTDSSFFDRNILLSNPVAYPTKALLEAMAADIQFTGDAMLKVKDPQDRVIQAGAYKGQSLFVMMKKVTSEDVFQFLRYVYVRPDKYKGYDWKVSETFATWAINGAPKAL